jgi:hypothetical protein
MPVVQGYIKGPMWIHFLVGVSAMYFSVPDTSNLLVHLFDNNNFFSKFIIIYAVFPCSCRPLWDPSPDLAQAGATCTGLLLLLYLSSLLPKPFSTVTLETEKRKILSFIYHQISSSNFILCFCKYTTHDLYADSALIVQSDCMLYLLRIGYGFIFVRFNISSYSLLVVPKRSQKKIGSTW